MNDCDARDASWCRIAPFRTVLRIVSARAGAMKRRTSSRRTQLSTGTAFASLAVMSEMRQGAADRRASRRGGRRASDTLRDDLDALHLKWDELQMDAGGPAVASGEAGADQRVADHTEADLGRIPVRPRK